MRIALVALAGVMMTGQAIAADYLRGSMVDAPPPMTEEFNWSGIYVGAQVGYSNANYDFSGGTHDLVARLLRQTTIENEAHVSDLASLPNQDRRSTSYGAFFGYNAQWGRAIVGLEINYNSTQQTATSSDSIGRAFTASDGYTYSYNVDSTSTIKLTDYGSLRARVGYAWDWVMPYAMIGLAAARADTTRTATVSMAWVDSSGQNRPGGAFVDTLTETKNGQIGYGYMTGIGIDVGLMPGVFIRAEYEFMQLYAIGQVKPQINTARVAAAVKF